MRPTFRNIIFIAGITMVLQFAMNTLGRRTGITALSTPKALAGTTPRSPNGSIAGSPTPFADFFANNPQIFGDTFT